MQIKGTLTKVKGAKYEAWIVKGNAFYAANKSMILLILTHSDSGKLRPIINFSLCIYMCFLGLASAILEIFAEKMHFLQTSIPLMNQSKYKTVA